jgi:hypothetical protein
MARRGGASCARDLVLALKLMFLMPMMVPLKVRLCHSWDNLDQD